MNFKCIHCEKETHEIMVMVEGKYLVHKGCEDDFKTKKLLEESNDLEDKELILTIE